MAGGEYEPITVSRRIGSPASVIFQILADPGRHRDLDGSGMLRGVVSGGAISGAGDVFVMKMYFTELGDYEMNNHIVEYEPDRRIGHGVEILEGQLATVNVEPPTMLMRDLLELLPNWDRDLFPKPVCRRSYYD